MYLEVDLAEPARPALKTAQDPGECISAGSLLVGMSV